MEQRTLKSVFTTVHLIYHRNKNQHGATAWWKWLSILRRSFLKLIDAAGNEKRCRAISTYLVRRVIPKAYIAFSTVVADGQFSTLGTVLQAALAETKKVLQSIPMQRRRRNPVKKKKKRLSLAAQTRADETANDLGVPIRRSVEHLSGRNEIILETNKTTRVGPISESPSTTQAMENLPVLDNTTTVKVKKPKSKKKKSAIDDIFGALR